MKVQLQEISWVEARKYFRQNDIAIIPVGSIEQHGPHNPLGTDHLIAKALAEEAAKQTGVLCLPAVPFGVSLHHKPFWGTICISPETLQKYVEDICLSLKCYGIRKIVIVNGHGGNLNALTELARKLREEGIFISVFQWWSAAAQLLPNLFAPEERMHAGAEETSVVLRLDAKLVDMEKAVDETPRKSALQMEGISLPFSTVDYTSSGVFGKSSTASTERGRQVFEAVTKELSRHIDALKKAKIEDLMQQPTVLLDSIIK